MFIDTFSNVSINYSPGKSLFWSDLLSRQYNKVILDDCRTRISKEWSQILPPISKKMVGITLTPKYISDFILSNPTKERLDCFCKIQSYEQNLQRYFTLKNIDKSNPKELDFLAQLYTGLESPTLTQLQLNEISKSIKHFPSESLKKANKSLNLPKLRKELKI